MVQQLLLQTRSHIDAEPTDVPRSRQLGADELSESMSWPNHAAVKVAGRALPRQWSPRLARQAV